MPPPVITDPPTKYLAVNQTYGMTIGIERTRRGRLWASWVGGGDNDRAFMLLATSDDGGRTWSDPKLVIDPHDDATPLRRRSVVANLWTDPLGRLWFFFDQSMTQFDGRDGTWCVRCDDPDAERPQWTAPRRLWHGCSLNKPIVLKDGQWLLPVSLWARIDIQDPFKDHFQELDHLRGANVLASTDQGETWTHRGGVAFPDPNFDEHSLVERADGSIWMTARTKLRDIWESTSRDGGRTWSAPQPSGIACVNSRHQVRRLASGRLLLIKHGQRIDQRTSYEPHPYRGRSHMTAFLSDDDGRTWTGGLVIDERLPVTYPDVIQRPDGLIYVSYDYERERLGQMLLATFREADVLAGKFVSPDTRQRQLIYQPLGKKHE